jgi:NADH dehydrogenase
MATIGRNRAVAWIYNRVPLTGFLAWFSWIFLHLIWLFGFRNRLNVLINWIWYYFAQDRAVRLIFEPEKLIDEKVQHSQLYPGISYVIGELPDTREHTEISE